MGRSNREARDKPLSFEREDPQEETQGNAPWIDREPAQTPPMGRVGRVAHDPPPPQGDGEGPDGGVTVDGHQWT